MSKFDKSFKKEAVRLALTSEHSIAQTARDLGVNESTLYNWISASKNTIKKNKDGTHINEPDLVEELNRLRKENSRLKEEREILKKFATFIVKDQK